MRVAVRFETGEEMGIAIKDSDGAAFAVRANLELLARRAPRVGRQPAE